MNETLPKYCCTSCGGEEFEAYSNDYELRLVCTRCQNCIFERVDE